MKSKLFLAALALTACGKPQTTASVMKDDSVNKQYSLCATYAKTQDLVSFKSVNPLTETVSTVEKAMIQAAETAIPGAEASPEFHGNKIPKGLTGLTDKK